jgi:hypothetical protein
MLVTCAGYAPEPHPSHGAVAEPELHRALTRSRLAPRTETASLRALGWVVSDRGEVEVALERGDRGPVPGGQLLRRPSPDLVEHFRRQGRDWPWAGQARFELAVERAGGAFLVLRRDGREVERLPLWVQPLRSRTPGVLLWVDAVQVESREGPPPHQRALDQLRLGVLAGIGRGYGAVLPAATGLVALLVPWLLVSPERRVVLVTVAGWFAAICLRLVILALVDVTSFPAIHPLYLAPAYPLLLAGVLVLAHEGVAGATRWVRRARPAPVPVQATHQ